MAARRAPSTKSINAMEAELRGPNGPGSPNWHAEDTHTARTNQALIETFRANRGKVPGEPVAHSFLLLTARGAKTGLARTVPLAAHAVKARLFVVGSMSGADRDPPWFHNVVANPDVTVEWRGETFPARAV